MSLRRGATLDEAAPDRIRRFQASFRDAIAFGWCHPWVETHGYHHEVAAATRRVVLQS